MAAISAFFKYLLASSLQITVLICLILLVQTLLADRLKPRWRWALWLVLVARMLIPSPPESPFSLFNLSRLIPERRAVAPVYAPPETTASVPNPVTAPVETFPPSAEKPFLPIAIETAFEESVSPDAPVSPPVVSAPLPARETAVRRDLPLVPLAWLVGAVALAAGAIAQSIMLAAKTSRLRPLTDPAVLAMFDQCRKLMRVRAALAVVESPDLSSPALLGLLRPRLVLPTGLAQRLDAAALRFVFLHELAHVKRLDIATNCLVAALQCIHWFNPLVWYAFYRMRADRELASDALALSHTQPGENSNYGRTILALTESLIRRRRLVAMVGILENGRHLKRRIAMIAAFKHGSYRWSVFPVALIALLAFVTLTNAQSRAPHRQEPFVVPAVFAFGEMVAPETVGTENELSKDTLEGEARRFFDQAKERIEAGDYAGAVGDLDKVLELQPDSAYARVLRDLVKEWAADAKKKRDAALALRDKAVAGDATMEQRIALMEARRVARLSGAQRRDEQDASQPTPEEREVLKKLAKRLAYFDFTGQPLPAMVDFLRQTGKVNIVLDPRAFSPGMMVTLIIEDATIKSILDLMTAQAYLNWTIVDNYVYMSDDPGIDGLKSRGPTTTADLDPDGQQIADKLAKRLAYFDFQKQPLTAMVDFLRQTGSVNIVLDPTVFSPETTVSLTIEDAAIKSILDLMTAQTDLNWTIVDNYVYISDDHGIANLNTRGLGASVIETRRPEKTPGAEAKDIEKKLAAHTGHFGVDPQPFINALEFFRKATGLKLVLDPRTDASAKTVAFSLDNGTYKAVLDIMTSQAGVDWVIVDDYVYISDEDGIAVLKSRGPGEPADVGGFGGGARALSEIEEKLQNTIPYFDFPAQPFPAILQLLSTAYNLNIVADPKVMPGPEKTVKFQLADATIKTILDLATQQVGLKWMVRENYVFISNEAGIATAKAVESALTGGGGSGGGGGAEVESGSGGGGGGVGGDHAETGGGAD